MSKETVHKKFQEVVKCSRSKRICGTKQKQNTPPDLQVGCDKISHSHTSARSPAGPGRPSTNQSSERLLGGHSIEVICPTEGDGAGGSIIPKKVCCILITVRRKDSIYWCPDCKSCAWRPFETVSYQS